MAVTLNTAGAAASGDTGTGGSASVSVASGSNTVLFAAAHYMDQTQDPGVTSLTYPKSSSPTAMDAVSSGNTHTAGFETPTIYMGVYTFTMAAPDTGANNLTVTFAETVFEWVVGGESYDGAHQTTPAGTPVTANGTSAPSTITLSSITSTSGDMIGGALTGYGASAAALSVNTGTEAWEGFVGVYTGTVGGGLHNAATGSSETVAWDKTGGSGYAAVAFSIQQAAAGGTTVPALDEGMFVGGLMPLAGGLD